MRTKLFLIVFTLISLNGFSQDRTSSNLTQAQNILRPDLEKFYGTWVYEKGGVYFEIVLIKKMFSSSPQRPQSERVVGTHIYKKNGKVIDEKRDSDSLTSINIGFIIDSHKNKISFRFNEYRRSVISNGTMEYLDGPTPALVWKLSPNQNRRMIILPGQEHLKDPEFIVPTDMIFHKLK